MLDSDGKKWTTKSLAITRDHCNVTCADPSPEILTAFFYGRALAITLNKRLSEAVIDLVSDVSKAMAERPQRIAEFQVGNAEHAGRREGVWRRVSGQTLRCALPLER